MRVSSGQKGILEDDDLRERLLLWLDNLSAKQKKEVLSSSPFFGLLG